MVSMSIEPKAATVDDLLRIPEDGYKRELVDGKIVVSPCGMRHSRIGSRIGQLLWNAAEATSAGEVYTADVGILLPGGNLRSPDVSFIRRDRLPDGETPEGFGEIVPDLVVEVLSPNDRMRLVADKIGEFLENGARLVWLVDPRSRTVTIYRSLSDTDQLSETDTITGGSVLPEFSVPVSAFFR